MTLATNGPGPRHRLGLMGKKVDSVLPIPPTALQLSTGVAVLSYGDELVFGITAGYDEAPELEQLAAGIDRGMARLVALSQDSVLLFTKDRRKRSSRAPAHRRATTPDVGADRASATLTSVPGAALTTVRRLVVRKFEPVIIDPRRHDAVLFALDAVMTDSASPR